MLLSRGNNNINHCKYVKNEAQVKKTYYVLSLIHTLYISLTLIHVNIHNNYSTSNKKYKMFILNICNNCLFN